MRVLRPWAKKSRNRKHCRQRFRLARNARRRTRLGSREWWTRCPNCEDGKHRKHAQICPLFKEKPRDVVRGVQTVCHGLPHASRFGRPGSRDVRRAMLHRRQDDRSIRHACR